MRARAREMGFDGKTLIHPSQVEPANEAFAPSAKAESSTPAGDRGRFEEAGREAAASSPSTAG